MRPIKFRGRDIDSGEYVFAELGQVSEEINPGYLSFITEGDVYTVDSDSVVQLVGYDANGKEVYEGDTVIEEYVEGKRQEHIARLESMTQVPETAQFYFFPFPAPFTTFKEADQ